MAEIVKIHGLAELNAKLKTLPVQLQKKVLRGALGSGAKVIKLAAVQLAPISARPVSRGKGRVTQPGVLKAAAIIKFVREQSNDTQSLYIVTFRKGKKAQRIGKQGVNKDAFYASWVEFGHKIVPRRKGAYTSFKLFGRGRRTGISQRRKGATGQVEGRRFLTRAFNTQVRQALEVITDRVRSGFDAAVR